MALPSPTGLWPETPDASGTISWLYWKYDVPTTTWTLTSDPTMESGKLADAASTGTYTLRLAASITPSMPILRVALRATTGTILTL